MMGGAYYQGAAAGQGSWMQMMRITASRASMPAGEVSFRARNAGSLTHELVILPLPAGGAGSRPVGAAGAVSERGSLGEASASCAAGAGEGITPGAAGWVTLHLAPGRYELICNLPGHYAMGMHTELDAGSRDALVQAPGPADPAPARAVETRSLQLHYDRPTDTRDLRASLGGIGHDQAIARLREGLR